MAVIGTVLPAELLDPSREDDAMIFIAMLPLDPRDRKRLVVEWAAWVGVTLTREMIEKAGASDL